MGAAVGTGITVCLIAVAQIVIMAVYYTKSNAWFATYTMPPPPVKPAPGSMSPAGTIVGGVNGTVQMVSPVAVAVGGGADVPFGAPGVAAAGYPAAAAGYPAVAAGYPAVAAGGYPAPGAAGGYPAPGAAGYPAPDAAGGYPLAAGAPGYPYMSSPPPGPGAGYPGAGYPSPAGGGAGYPALGAPPLPPAAITGVPVKAPGDDPAAPPLPLPAPAPVAGYAGGYGAYGGYSSAPAAPTATPSTFHQSMAL